MVMDSWFGMNLTEHLWDGLELELLSVRSHVVGMSGLCMSETLTKFPTCSSWTTIPLDFSVSEVEYNGLQQNSTGTTITK